MNTGPGRVRIIGGRLRNSRLDVRAIEGLRPTPERVRETLFNWLVPVIDGARVLDLCAGTGALGIEALSRGAAEVTFVERDRRAAEALRANLARLHVDSGQVVVAEAQRFLATDARRFDLVFLDPPFALDLWQSLAHALEDGGWLAPNAWIYVEAARQDVPKLPPQWQAHRSGAAGMVAYALYRRHADASAKLGV